MHDNDDGRSPEWEPGSVPLDLWEAVIAHGPISGPDVGRLRMVLDGLHEAAELLDLARSGGMTARDTIAAYAGVRVARKAASDLVAALTGAPKRGPGRPAKPTPTHGHRRT